MAELVTHSCGKTWRQAGNRTGHCGACHETFEGLTLFDAHQRLSDDGSVICTNPATMVYRGSPLTADEYGTWRGPGMPDDVKAKFAAVTL